MTNYPQSTIAWSVYNTMAVFLDGPVTHAGLFELLTVGTPGIPVWNVDLEEEELTNALDALVEREFAILTDSGEYDTKDPGRRAAISRDRMGDGWFNWQMEAVPGTLKRQVKSRMIETISASKVIQ